jgi:hypothetical protein
VNALVASDVLASEQVQVRGMLLNVHDSIAGDVRVGRRAPPGLIRPGMRPPCAFPRYRKEQEKLGRDNLPLTDGVLRDLLADGDGMHQTMTMNIGWMIEGELGVETDDGSVEWLTTGDLIVQNGTRHRWRNRSGKPAVAGFVTQGARRP